MSQKKKTSKTEY